MEIFKEIAPLQDYLELRRRSALTIGLVPTMGALHEGHLSLISASKSQNDVTVCSLYVNPTQFNNATDLDRYPRTLEKDKAMLKDSGCDVLFAPLNTSMYPKTSTVRFDFGALDKILEGEFRPGHFSGVALIVSKLFNIVQPNQSYFGQKDFQQFQVITKLAEELRFNTKLHCMPTVRESDGLARSSRNLRLSPVERKRATILYETLSAARKGLLEKQPWKDIQHLHIRSMAMMEGIRLEYLELANRTDLTIRDQVNTPDAILLMACYVGEVRLIDNLLV